MKAFCAAIAALPFSLLALPTGAPSGHAGVDGEQTCLACHRGIALNSGGGNVSVTFPGSLTYRPGVRQRLRVTVNDTVAAEFGFQITARLTDDPKQPGGSFSLPPSLATATPPGGPGGFPGGPFGLALRPVCWSGNPDDDDVNKPAAGCPADKPIESLVQGRPSFSTGAGTASWEFDWTPPASATGPLTLWLASNASEDEDHARIYTASYTLQPAVALRPAVTRISLAPGYGAGTVYSPGTWIIVEGRDLAGSTRQWSTSDFAGTTAPSDLDSVRVLVGGKPAFVSLESPTGLSAQIPADTGTGGVPLVVSINGTNSAPTPVTLALRSPYIAARSIAAKQYIIASIDGGGQVSPPRGQGGPGGGGPGGGGPGFGNARPAAPGDVIRFNGIGFGATVPNIAPGQRATAGSTVPNVEVKFGDIAAEVRSAALLADQVGIYQLQVVVPDGLPSGEVPVTITVDGIKSTQDVLLPTR